MSIALYARLTGHKIFGKYFPPPKTPIINIPFRCYPVDFALTIDHMNNASFIRVSEIARLRIAHSTGLLSNTKLPPIVPGIFVVVEQKALYKKNIKPFQKYIVSTIITTSDNKWLHFKHRFLEHPSDVREGQSPVEYCVVECRCVVKEMSGKTVYVDQLKSLSEWSQIVLDADLKNV